MPRARTAADAPPEKHPFHLFRPKTRVSDANTRASMANLEYGLQGKKQRLTSIFDYDRLDELV